MHENITEDKIEIDILEADEWIERISKTADEMCNNNRIKLKTSESGQRTGLIIKSNDSAALSYIGYAIEQHLDTILLSYSQHFKKYWKMLMPGKQFWKDLKF